MSLKYNNKVIDLVFGNFYILYKFQNNLIIVFFIMSLWIVNNISIEKGKSITYKIIYNSIVIVPAFLFLNIILLILFLLKFGINYKLGRVKGLVCEHELTIEGERLIEKTSVNETHHNIKGLVKLCETKRYVYIFVNSQGVHIIPKKRIDSKELNEFLNQLRSLM